MKKSDFKRLIREVIDDIQNSDGSFFDRSGRSDDKEVITAKSGQLTKTKIKVNGTVQLHNNFGTDISVTLNNDVPGVIHIHLGPTHKPTK